MKDDSLYFLITYYAKKYREIITRKGTSIDHKTKYAWTTPKGSYCFCYYDLDAATVKIHIEQQQIH